MARLTAADWKAIRTVWEYDPDAPTYNVAASRASEKFKFDAPAKTTIESRAKKEGWERIGSLNSINAAAQLKADKLTNSDGTPLVSDGKPPGISDASEAQKAQAARDESENKRAEVVARYRREWYNVSVLCQEALNIHTSTPVGQCSRV